MMDKQLQGRRSKALGDIFEIRIGHALDRYEAEGIAMIQKTPEPFKVIRSIGKGRFEGYFEKKGQPDFKGCLCDGSAIIFEAKHTDSDRILQTAVTDTQEKYFNQYEKMGARCYVMVSIGLRNFYRVPWDVWKDMSALFGHKYMNEKELKPYQLSEICGWIRILDGIEIGKGEPDESTED